MILQKIIAPNEILQNNAQLPDEMAICYWR
jgi:hypothetical protein